MKTIVYTGPGHILAAGHHRIQRGVPTEISDQLFDQLQRDPSMTLTVIEPAGKRRRKRKSPATKADPQAAIQAAHNADSGEED